MKTKSKLISLLIVMLMISVQSFATWRPGEMEVQVKYSSRAEVQQIQSLNISVDFYSEYAVAYVVKEELNALLSMGFEVEILEKDLDKRNGKSVPDGYYSYQEIIDIADSLAQHFPSICSKTVAGYSYLNRQLAYLKISDNVLTDEAEPEVLFEAGIHGDEVGASQNAIMYARELVLGYGNDPEITDLIDNREIYIYLMVNPDGRESMSRYNNNGMDINRDWGYMWDHEGSTDSAFCQEEARVLRDFILDHEFVIHTTYHSGTEYISCPWSYRADEPEDLDHILFLAGIYSSSSGYANLDYGQGSTGMYYINGASKDYNYGAVGSVSWSMEISYSKQPPASEIMMFYNYNVPAMHAMCEYSGYGLEGMVTDVTTGEPVAAVILVNDFYPTHTDPEVGDFHKYLMEGTYSVTVKANGYEEVTIDNVVIESNTSLTHLDIELQPMEGQYIYYLNVVEIPGNNFDDEAYTPAIYGAPDEVYYSLGKNGFVYVDMGSSVFDKSGMDLIVYEGDETPEGYNLYASQFIDGPYSLVGSGSGTTEFDLNTSGLINARYFKIIDDGDGNSNGDNAGFDLDAVAVINPPLAATDPVPANNSTASVFSDLQWTPGDGGISNYYKLYFGTDNPPTNIVHGDEITENMFHPDLPLEYNTTYYWRVDAVNQYGTATGNLWQFTTGGEPDEDFETGDFSLYNWTFDGDANWEITEDVTRNGAYSARSGAVDDMQSSSLILEGNCSGFGKISFWKKTSSQPADVLQFYMNDILMGSWGGDGEWQEHSFNTGPGPYTFEWRYVKSEAGQSYDDCAYIDFMYIPEMSAVPPTVNAGEDVTVCEGDIVQLDATAANFTSLEWTTDGDGEFNNNSILNPEYYPGEEDILNQTVTLTLTAFGTIQVEDYVVAVIDPLPGQPTKPEGAVHAGWNMGEYTYSTLEVPEATSYFWEVLPEGSAEVISNGSFEGVFDFVEWDHIVYIHVKALNDCGESIWSESLEVLVDYVIGIDEFSTGMQIIPNPVLGNSISIMGYEGTGEVIIMDLTGRKCLTYENYNIGSPIHIKELDNGLYLVKLIQGEKVYTGKLVKE